MTGRLRGKRVRFGAVFLPLLLVSLPACSVVGYPSPITPSAPTATGGGGPTADAYEVDGRTYRVLATAEGYRARGIASWYGPGFHGLPTSSGERFDQEGMTAAHRTLPLGTRVRVTNLENGKSVVVRINDRGPFKDPDRRIIDLSRRAARELEILGPGTALVEVVALDGGSAGGIDSSGGELEAKGFRSNRFLFRRPPPPVSPAPAFPGRETPEAVRG